jgi:subtilisin-like proprotein convertase family protein
MGLVFGLRRLCLVVCLLCLSVSLVAQDDGSTPPVEGDFSGEWAVQFTPGTDAEAAARRLGLAIIAPIANLPNTYLLRAPGTTVCDAGDICPLTDMARASNDTLPLAEDDDEIVFAYPQHWFNIEFFAPTDPLYPQQWHLNNVGQSGGTPTQDIRAEGAWNAGFDGTGVVVAIVDNGVEYTHPDLAANYLPAFSQDFVPAVPDPDPMPDTPFEGHGTATAGLAVGDDDGAACGAGVAYNAGFSGIRFPPTLTDSRVSTFLSYARDDNDIYSNSWGFATGVTAAPTILPLTLAALANNAQNGRGGLGNIYVFAGGNGTLNQNAGRSALLTTRYTIAVGATDDNGVRSSYSEPGSVLLVNAPGGAGDIVTTDMQGVAGFVPGDCHNTFTGTSAAVPLVAGTVALMLDANPLLNWRDVQYILAETADQNDPGNAGWRTNGAGYRFNTLYGYGRVNANRAARMAAGWQPVPTEAPLLTSGVQFSGQPIPDNSPGAPLVVTFDFNIPISQHMVIEHVQVNVDIPHGRHGDIAARLISPAGTAVDLMTPRTPTSFGSYQNFTWMSVASRGESPLGTWRLEITDNAAGVTGTLNTWELRITGIPPLANDLFADATDLGTLAAPFVDISRAIQTTRELFDPIPSCANGTSYRSAWYRYTPADETTITLTTRNSQYNTVLSVWTGAPGLFTEIGCDDNSGGVPVSLIENLPVSAGTTYYIMVSSFDRFFGRLEFRAEIGQPVAVIAPPATAESLPIEILLSDEPTPELLAQVTLLPATGEIPFWATALRAAIGLAVVLIGSIGLWLRRR